MQGLCQVSDTTLCGRLYALSSMSALQSGRDRRPGQYQAPRGGPETLGLAITAFWGAIGVSEHVEKRAHFWGFQKRRSDIQKKI